MKFSILLFSLVALGYLSQFFFPWWAIVPIAFIGGMVLAKNGPHAFTAGFLAIFLLWAVQSLWISSANEGILADKMGILLGGLPGIALPWVSALVGGLLSGFGALSGFLGRRAFA
jgi:hypothetical protein